MAEFFAMGGYGVYIWPCYLASAAVIGGLIYRQIGRLRSLRDREQHGRSQNAKP
ncbi:MAG: heme exporter protein CcmD [Pseudomonadota bacterium]